MAGKKKALEPITNPLQAKFERIRETCKNTQYCHECKEREFCTSVMGAGRPRYWGKKHIEKMCNALEVSE